MRIATMTASLTAAAVAACAFAAPASAALPHVVAPGETLWSISAANGLTTRTVAVFNGVPEDAHLVAGETIEVPTVDEGAAALATAPPPDPATTQAAAPIGAEPPAPTDGSTAWLSHIDSTEGRVHLDPAAAAAWEAMRAEALATYGIDLYAAGTLSAYRTYEQQSYLYDLFLGGQGAPANPPGTSTHELGIAVDVPDPAMRSVVDEIGAAYGWSGSAVEWWHVEYSG